MGIPGEVWHAGWGSSEVGRQGGAGTVAGSASFVRQTCGQAATMPFPAPPPPLCSACLPRSSDASVVKGAIALLKQRRPQTKVLISVGGATYPNWDKVRAGAVGYPCALVGHCVRGWVDSGWAVRARRTLALLPDSPTAGTWMLRPPSAVERACHRQLRQDVWAGRRGRGL